jgi:hypothetical protein
VVWAAVSAEPLVLRAGIAKYPPAAHKFGPPSLGGPWRGRVAERSELALLA